MSADDKIMIQIRDLKKEYRLGQIGYGTLQKDLQSWWAKRRGKVDPNSKLGQEERIEGDTLRALNGVDLTVYRGECLGIIGGNGAGKSTLLKLISRVASPSGGTIDLYGRVTSMLEVGTGFNGEMTGRENIYLNGTILGMSKSEIDAKMEEIINFSEVEEFIDTPVKRYSSGMYVKLGFSVASHLDSEIVIMDEVLAVGDIAFQQKCINKMRQSAREENRTVLYVSHNMSTVRELCDRCIVLAEGKIIYDGDTEEAIAYYTRYLQSRNETVTDYLSKNRRAINLTDQIRIADIKVLHDVIPMGGMLRFDMKFNAKRNMDNIMVRLIVCNGPGEIVGMAYSDPVHMNEGDNWFAFSFPVGNLASGEYVCDIAISEYDGNVDVRHDFLSKVMAFSIREERTYFGRSWSVRRWGNVVFDTIKAEEIRHEQD